MASSKPHAVFVPTPCQGHVKAVLKLAKLLHHRGFHITFVNTEFIHKRFLKSLGRNSLDGLPDFRFETIPDGLPACDADVSQDMRLLCENNHMKTMLPSLRHLLMKLNNVNTNNGNPPVTCIISDGFMWMLTIPAAQEIGVPIALVHTIAAATFMGYKQFSLLLQKGLVPLKDESCLTNGYMETTIDWVPGMKDIRLKDLPTFIQTTDPNDTMFNYFMQTADSVHTYRASAVVFLTFDALEQEVLDALSSMFDQPSVYAIGPTQLLLNQMRNDPLKNMGHSLWKEEPECLQWLSSKPPNSVIYVNFGSVAFLTPNQLLEFGWGLANSKVSFLWGIRPDIIMGESASFPPEFIAESKERGLMVAWCPQEEVLSHPSVGGFLTHCGWNSIMEGITAGVPMLCWPFFADQQPNCFNACSKWGIGMEISNGVKREEVERLVKELMEGKKGKEMKNKVMEWKKLAEEATAPGGSSSTNLEDLVNNVLLRKI